MKVIIFVASLILLIFDPWKY